jgi:hypothetical protein
VDNPERRQQEPLGRSKALAIECPAPAQVIGQVAQTRSSPIAGRKASSSSLRWRCVSDGSFPSHLLKPARFMPCPQAIE